MPTASHQEQQCLLELDWISQMILSTFKIQNKVKFQNKVSNGFECSCRFLSFLLRWQSGAFQVRDGTLWWLLRTHKLIFRKFPPPSIPTLTRCWSETVRADNNNCNKLLNTFAMNNISDCITVGNFNFGNIKVTIQQLSLFSKLLSKVRFNNPLRTDRDQCWSKWRLLDGPSVESWFFKKLS